MEAARYANSLLLCVVVMPKFVRKQNVLYNSVRTLRKNWENSNYNNACRQWSTELGNRFWSNSKYSILFWIMHPTI